MNEVEQNKKAPDRWTPDGHDYILHLGTMRKAVVVARYVPSLGQVWNGKNSWYAISPRSYFPFTDEQQEKRFETAIEAISYAEVIILEWLNSITIGFNKPSSGSNKIKQEQKLLEE
jgi:hypothetical protein